jgi:pilus assembly protein CpaC
MRNSPPLPAFAVALTRAAALFAALATAAPAAETAQAAAGRTEEIAMTVGKAVILDHPDEITRVSISDPAVADAVAVSTKEVLLNAKGPGITTLVIWSKSGERNLFTLNVSANLQQMQQQLQQTFPGENIQVIVSHGTVSLIGKASSPAVAEKAALLVSALGKSVVNNLAVPALSERQVVLKVRFAELQRTAILQYGVNLFSTGALNTPGQTSTQQFGTPRAPQVQGTIGAPVSGYSTDFTISDALNIFAFRPDLNLGALIRALRSQNLIEILAEPNVVATSGKEAVLLVGGEFPVPVVQGGGNAGAVTIQFREFGIRINFLPVVTPGDTIKLHVRPEVSSLDFANAVTLAGFTIPALSTRRVETDVELAPGQSFAIAGLLDQRVTDNLNKVPGLASIPLLGSLFKSRIQNKSNSELLVLVTPEFTAPLTASDKKPELEFPTAFLPRAPKAEGRP